MNSYLTTLIRQAQDMSRQLALQAGSVISSRPDDPALVLANTQPVADFLLGGDLDDTDDLLNRRRAVRQHLGNIRSAAAVPVDDPEAFLAPVRAYYAFLALPPLSADVRDAEAQG